jgi:antitoxin MazE
MRAAVRKMGNSSGVIIPKPLLGQVGLQTGDDVELTLEGGKIVLAPVKAYPRQGWAEASQAVAEAGDDQLAWPEFGNEDDESWTW